MQDETATSKVAISVWKFSKRWMDKTLHLQKLGTVRIKSAVKN